MILLLSLSIWFCSEASEPARGVRPYEDRRSFMNWPSLYGLFFYGCYCYSPSILCFIISLVIMLLFWLRIPKAFIFFLDPGSWRSYSFRELLNWFFSVLNFETGVRKFETETSFMKLEHPSRSSDFSSWIFSFSGMRGPLYPGQSIRLHLAPVVQRMSSSISERFLPSPLYLTCVAVSRI